MEGIALTKTKRRTKVVLVHLVGNRTTSFLSSLHNHDDLNRLLEDDAFMYTYDNNGNLVTKTENNGVRPALLP